jgi:hypothetical protein
MIDNNGFTKIVENACSETIHSFIDNESEILKEKKKNFLQPEEVFGANIDVSGKRLKYGCILQYSMEQSALYINLLTKKYPMIDDSESPDIDILDLLGEFLNILCGKINKELVDIDDELNIEIPFFVHGLSGEQKLETTEFKFGELKFYLHFHLES